MVNSNPNWTINSDTIVTSLKHISSIAILQQLLTYADKGLVVLTVIKCVEDILALVNDNALRLIATAFGERLKLGNVSHGSGCMPIFLLCIFQKDNYLCLIYSEKRLLYISPYSFLKVRWIHIAAQ